MKAVNFRGQQLVLTGGGGGVLTNINVSAGTTSNNLSNVVFSNLNGVSFGLAGSTITASHNGLTSQSNQAFSADVSSTFQTLTFQDSNGVSFSNNAGALRVTHALQFTSNTSNITSNALHSSASRVINLIAATNNAGGGTASLSSNVSFSNANGATFYTSAGNAIVLSYTVPAAGAVLAISAAGNSVSAGTVVWSNSNNVSFGMNASTITATAAITQSFGISNITQGGSTAGTTGMVNGDDIQFVFVPGSNITMSQSINGSSGTLSIFGPAAGGNTISYLAIPPVAINTATMSFAQSTSYFVPANVDQILSLDRMRLVASGSMAASSTQATTGGTSLSLSAITSHNIVIYSRGAGASSLSLQYLTSTQVVDQQLVTISYAANSTQYSVSNRLTIGGASFTKDYSQSSGTVNWHTSNLTDLSGVKQYDVALGISLSPGQYWIGYGRSTNSATQNASVSVGTRLFVSFNSMIGVTQNTLQLGTLGGATNSSVGWWPGHGSFTTAGGGSTSSLGFSNVSTTASNQALYMQLMRIV